MTAADGEVVNVYVQDELLAADPTAGQVKRVKGARAFTLAVSRPWT